ncbi:DegT/DnrJ/EryC1/StrS aminotransferase family protein [Micromonospora sp. KC723]|uniref:DegT/DnrJ/EryC1/StrS family aminotransferase n=1 Tax=Micromonospora sp. KC723 TaxID=2530381 RepID=UPI001043BBCB|nr:DegT/DnrJ/EryC1/StrS family aminotransferase [Micromonospora sp. KC723]TDB74898.1 DegT/DnrJ/EryC1/StrS family aminotransferase [Micromonospora sp. KC723]
MSAPTARRWRVTLADNTVDEQEIEAVTEVLRSRWLSAGAQTAAFEREFADRLGTDDAVAVSSGTAALHLAMMALDLRPGDEVIMPALTFVASAAVVALAGATPVLADVRAPDDLTVDPGDVTGLVTERTRAVVAMHYAGYPADLAALRAVTDRHGVVLVEDAAHAPVVEHHGRMLGTYGDIGCFSFFATKNVTSGEGGMVVARDRAVRERIRLARSHHLTASTWDRLSSGDASYDVAGLGLNYRPTEVAAALGRVQLGRLPLDRARRRALVATYREVLAAAPELVLPFAGRTGDSALHLMPVVLPEGTDRGAVREDLAAAGVQTSVHYPPVHHLSAYRDSTGAGRSALTVTEAVAPRLLSLPLHSRMSDDDAVLAAETLLRCLRVR